MQIVPREEHDSQIRVYFLRLFDICPPPRSDAYADYTLYYTLTKVSMKTGGTKMTAQGF